MYVVDVKLCVWHFSYMKYTLWKAIYQLKDCADVLQGMYAMSVDASYGFSMYKINFGY